MKRGSFFAWWAWTLAVVFLFYEFIIRVFPTIMVENLMSAFSVKAAALGTLSAFFFYAYAPMQIPVGLLMDRFGARRLLTFAAIFCAVGSFFFASADHIFVADIGRLLMGIGSAFAFVGMVYVCSHHFSAKKLALLVGIGNSIGMLGAVGAMGPMSFVVEGIGWRSSVHLLGWIGLALALILFLCLRGDGGKREPSHLLENLKIVCRNPNTYLNGVIGLLLFMTTAAFASLWGIPFLMKSYGFSKDLAGFIVSMIFVGWVVGGPIIGVISDRTSRRKPILYVSTLLTLAALLPVLYLPALPVWILFALLFLVGFFQSSELLCFSLSIELNPHKAKGTSIALTNCIIAFGTSLMQPLIGILLDLGWDGLLEEGVPVYSLTNYKVAMASFPVTLLLALFLLLFLKEKKHQEHETFSDIIGME